MAKTQLTRDIEAALHAWHPSSYGGYRVDSFRQGFDALEVPVECGSVKSGLVDFVRVQECFTSETKYGTCKLASLIETDTGASLAAMGPLFLFERRQNPCKPNTNFFGELQQ